MDVFISYCTEDKKIADAICHYIEIEKIKCWIAPRDVNGGQTYASEIVKAIKDCKILILVASLKTNNSQHVLNEVNLAVIENKIILPFKIDSSILNEDYIYYLGKTHWIEAFPEPDKHFSLLVKNVGDLLNKKTIASENLLLQDEAYLKERNRENLAKKTKERRLAFALSIESDENDFIDINHQYMKIKRIDVVESSLGKYSSYRWVTIKNASDKGTDYIVHKECGENKTKFLDMKIRAKLSNYKGEKLYVESLTKVQPNFSQVFKIHFPKALLPNEEIKIFYRIDWPGEPNSYVTDSLNQSISLVRYQCGVEEITFGVLEKEKLVGSYLKEIDKFFQERDTNFDSQVMIIDEDEDLKPLHGNGFNGVYYTKKSPKGLSYRIFYNLVTDDLNDDNDDLF